MDAVKQKISDEAAEWKVKAGELEKLLNERTTQLAKQDREPEIEAALKTTEHIEWTLNKTAYENFSGR
jgi:hypothetical protein